MTLHEMTQIADEQIAYWVIRRVLPNEAMQILTGHPWMVGYVTWRAVRNKIINWYRDTKRLAA